MATALAALRSARCRTSTNSFRCPRTELRAVVGRSVNRADRQAIGETTILSKTANKIPSTTPIKTQNTSFDGYIGIDWSGAAQAGYAGIAVARCAPGRAAPQLVPPPGKTWTRMQVLDWLLAELVRGPRLLIGMDFAFALPGHGQQAPALWAAVEARCAADPDLLGRAYAEGDPRFWTAGKQPPHWNAAPRATEIACRTAGLGNPQTPFQLIGAKQVGKGALAGMRLLHRLQRDAGHRVAIWPFDPEAGHDARSVCTEIYPRLFIRMGGLGNAKLRERDDLNAVLNRLASIGLAKGQFDDHQCDALVTAAGLRHAADDPALWAAGAGEPEGWIFGVPRSGDAATPDGEASLADVAERVGLAKSGRASEGNRSPRG